MFNSINKIISKYTGLLIRMDDICENMNWELMEKCELLFDKYKKTCVFLFWFAKMEI